MARTKCIWCGAPVTPRRTRCDKCAELSKLYNMYRKSIFKTSSKQFLIEFRNLCIDLKYNMPDAEKLPDDLDYQFDRVSRYIDSDTD